MKHRMKMFLALIAALAIAAIAAGFAFANGAATGRATVAVAKTKLGSILVDGKGIALYDFVLDKGKTSACYGSCASYWPPLLTTGKPIAVRGAHAALLGTTKRKDGKLEVTYAGRPLYYWIGDKKPGQTTGQGINQFGAPWWVLSPTGAEIHRR